MFFFHKVFFPFVTCVIFALFLFSFMYKGQSMGIITERKCFFISYEKQNDHKIFIFHVGKILIANFFQFYHSYLKKKNLSSSSRCFFDNVKRSKNNMFIKSLQNFSLFLFLMEKVFFYHLQMIKSLTYCSSYDWKKLIGFGSISNHF